jgi:hypothetical protein
MNVAHCSLLLGQAHALLKQCRAYLIAKQDLPGVELIEDQFLALDEGIKKLYSLENERE